MKPKRCDVAATLLDDTGRGVGSVDGARIHVADLLPGERAEVEIEHASPHRAEAWGRVVRRLGAASADRVAPACPAFGRCGGCAWQHLAYPAQLVAKRARVQAALGADVEVGAVRPSPVQLGYRNKGKYVAGRDGDRLVLGAYAPRTHVVVDTLGCRVVAPLIDELASWLRGAAEQATLTAYDERTRTGELRYAIVREAAGDVMVALVVAPGTPRAKLERVGAALANHAAVRGLVSIANDRRDGAIVPAGSRAQVLLGHGHLIEELAGIGVEVGAGEFVQVNRAQAAAMYARVAELALPARTALDLYAGLGGIGLHLAGRGVRVTAVEIDRDAVAALATAARDLPLTAIAGDAGSVEAAGSFDVVIVNPPRKGLSADARALLARLAPATLVYVSCGPEALGRDLAALGASYVPDVIEPFDLMPGTAQVETVVRLRRN